MAAAPAPQAANYHSDSAGTRLTFQCLTCAVSAMRSSAPLDGQWKADLDRDSRSRKKKE